MTDQPAPQTEAGRALVSILDDFTDMDLQEMVVAIEAQARTEALTCAVYGCTEPLELCATHAREGTEALDVDALRTAMKRVYEHGAARLTAEKVAAEYAAILAAKADR